MTIAQDKLSYIDVNIDDTITIKGILEFDPVDKYEPEQEKEGFSQSLPYDDAFLIYRIHIVNHAATILISDLVGSKYFDVRLNLTKVTNILWKEHLESCNIEPDKIELFIHRGQFSDGAFDISTPYRTNYDDYYEIILEWDGDKFTYDYDGERVIKYIRAEGEKKKYLMSACFDTVEGVAKKLNWQKGLNRIDIDHYKERFDAKGVKIVSNIHFWEHPDYPAHCLLRMYLHPAKAVILLTELESNIRRTDGDLCNEYDSHNSLVDCLPQVVNEVYQKYQSELGKYQPTELLFLYEHGEFSDPRSREVSPIMRHLGSSIFIIELNWDGKEFKLRQPDVEWPYENLDQIYDLEKANNIRYHLFGNFDTAMFELGWRNYQ
jgi:hypothetical protein